jgi:hypothetical protein
MNSEECKNKFTFFGGKIAFLEQKAACACSQSEFGHIRNDVSPRQVHLLTGKTGDPVMGVQRGERGNKFAFFKAKSSLCMQQK